MRKISTLMVSVLCMMMPVGTEAQVPTAFVSKGATDIQAQPHSVTQTNSGTIGCYRPYGALYHNG